MWPATCTITIPAPTVRFRPAMRSTRSVATGFAAAGGANFNLDWFTLGNHGGSGNRDCRFSDTSANIPGDTTKLWTQTLGQTIDGITITSLKGTQPANPTNMWRWQSIKEVEYPIVVNRTHMYNKVLVEGLEWIVPGHEHTDVAVIAGQNPRGFGNADNMAQFEFRFDRADNDAIGLLDVSNNQVWPGKDNVNNNGTAGHQKAVSGIQWLQANFPLQSYAIPTHSERAGPFNPAGKQRLQHRALRDFNNAGPTGRVSASNRRGIWPRARPLAARWSYGTGAVGGGDLWDERRLHRQGRRIVGRSARRRPQFLHLCQLRLAQSRRSRRT